VSDRADMARDKADIQTDRKDIAKDRADIRTDRQDVRMDRQDLRADRGDLRSDRSNFRSADVGDSHSNWQDQRLSRNTGQSATAGQGKDGAKPALTATTIANNAAENNKKVQATQNVHKAWYHIW
jgi:hypothetical protein